MADTLEGDLDVYDDDPPSVRAARNLNPEVLLSVLKECKRLKNTLGDNGDKSVTTTPLPILWLKMRALMRSQWLASQTWKVFQKTHASWSSSASHGFITRTRFDVVFCSESRSALQATWNMDYRNRRSKASSIVQQTDNEYPAQRRI